MTINTLLEKVKDEKPNSFGDERLIAFINEIEAEVADQLNMGYTPAYENTEADKEEELLVPAPYDRLYVSYVKAMIDYANEEYASYENNQMQHVQDFRDFVDWVVRTKQAQSGWGRPSRFRNVF
jgi:hypothetical protein